VYFDRRSASLSNRLIRLEQRGLVVVFGLSFLVTFGSLLWIFLVFFLMVLIFEYLDGFGDYDRLIMFVNDYDF
jgi:hypothetical protein